ncbi:hypothetical protein BHC44_06520 [Snodgrassella alvi]|nr:hypothetical protein BHC44_06520 [Snodgrassella alvi]
MKFKIRTLSKDLLLSILLGIGQFANAYELVCPESVTVKAARPELKVTPQHWEVSEHKDMLLTLDGVGVYGGNPLDLAQLKPEPTVVKGKKHYPVWEVDSKLDLDGVGFWLSCSYNHNQVQLTRRIDSTMKVCWAVYSKDSQGGLLAKLKCQ